MKEIPSERYRTVFEIKNIHKGLEIRCFLGALALGGLLNAFLNIQWWVLLVGFILAVIWVFKAVDRLHKKTESLWNRDVNLFTKLVVTTGVKGLASRRLGEAVIKQAEMSLGQSEDQP